MVGGYEKAVFVCVCHGKRDSKERRHTKRVQPKKKANVLFREENMKECEICGDKLTRALRCHRLCLRRSSHRW